MMKKALTIHAFLILSAIVLCSCVQPPSDMEVVAEIGRAAPDFTLLDLGGQEVSLDQFKGKIVLLDFWATWCGPCRLVMPLLERMQTEYSDTMVQLAINVMEPNDMVEEYVREQGIHALVLMDQEGSVSLTYGAIGIPTQVLIDREGIVRFVQEGFSPAVGLSQLRSEIDKIR